MTISKAIVVKLKFPLGEMHYNVQIIRSVDGGHNFFLLWLRNVLQNKARSLVIHPEVKGIL